jgi:hypothetical protein
MESVMSVYTEITKQGNKGDCVVVALKNIYKHFGVDINFTNRETVEHGYFPNYGVRDSGRFLKHFGVIFKEIPLSDLRKNNIGRIIKNGLNNGKIYAVSSFNKTIENGGHVHLITGHNYQESYYRFQNFRDRGHNYTLSDTINASDMFLAVNRRFNIWFDGSFEGRFKGHEKEIHCGAYDDTVSTVHAQLVDGETMLADLGIFSYEDTILELFSYEGSIFNEQRRNKKGILLEISGINETFKNRKLPVYKFNELLSEILKSPDNLRKSELLLYKNLHCCEDWYIRIMLDMTIKNYPGMFIESRVCDEYINYLSSDKLPCIIEGRGLPMVIEQAP